MSSLPSERRDALERLDPLRNELFPAEQAWIVRLLVERVHVGTAGMDMRLRTAGLAGLTPELGAIRWRVVGGDVATAAELDLVGGAGVDRYLRNRVE